MPGMDAHAVSIAAVMLSWFVLGLLLVRARMRTRRGVAVGDDDARGGATRKRDLASWGGLALQGVGFAIAFNARRNAGSPLLPCAPHASLAKPSLAKPGQAPNVCRRA